MVTEEGLIERAITLARSLGVDAAGPFPADTLFHRKDCDAFIAMYHDQGLIPVKTIDFKRTVNITLGLPFVQDLAEHGTGFDIAGKGIADPTGLVEAYRDAESIVAARSRCRPARGNKVRYPEMSEAEVLLTAVFADALAAADPYDAVARHCDELLSKDEKGGFTRLYVLAFGKAVAPMLRAITDRMGEKLTGGIAITKHGYRVDCKSDRITVHEG